MPSLRTLARIVILATGAGLLMACSHAGLAEPPRTLAAYADDAELIRALDRWRAEAARQQAERRQAAKTFSLPMMAAAPSPAAAPAPVGAAESAAAPQADAESITNVQTAGVDEGGIVKRAGDFLVVLRRGRLFTVRVGADALQPAAMADAFALGIDPRGAWYDELLVSGSTVVVVGYSYARGGTEIGLFELDARGSLQHRATHHLRSYDYYAARNYASRLIGRQLVFYSPTLLRPTGPHPLQVLPGLRHWPPQGHAADAAWQRILPATRIFRTDDDFDPSQALALHTITRCDLGREPLNCDSTAVLGPAGRVFYVSRSAVYVWTTGRSAGRPEAVSAVFRLPLDGAAPSGIKTVGVPIDQMSFLEDDQGHLNVLLRAQGAGEGMWGAHRLQGRTALLRLPLSALGDGRQAAQREHYRSLPAQHPDQNRFVGEWLLMNDRAARSSPRGDASVDGIAAWALRFADEAAQAQPLSPGHRVERIEALGAHAVLVGNAGLDLHFSAVRLAGSRAALAGEHVQTDARQGETRSHGFFYRAAGAGEGLLGLPVLQAQRGGAAVSRGDLGSASVVFLRERGLQFAALGALSAGGAPVDDACRASCVDWYGNARPLFLGDRVFALLGYELVEGRVSRRSGPERIEERRRVHILPQARPVEGRRYSPFTP